MIKNRKLAIFSETENFALYGLPDFNNKQRREYFSFSESEMLLIMQSRHIHKWRYKQMHKLQLPSALEV